SNHLLIRTDTFSQEEGKLHKGIFNGPFDINQDGMDLTFFNDTICLFASNRPGGFGGFDLYVSFLHDGKWTEGTNLGPVINSFYDERYPFLTRNGLTLFYSSNNLESVGGFDIFSTSFDPSLFKWSSPVNLGFPINSAGDDIYLAVAPDGTTAFLTSDRKEGYGGKDIYRVFFKQPIIAHQEISDVPTFQQLLMAQSRTGQENTLPEKTVDVKEYYVSHLFYEPQGEVMTPQNTKKLELISNLMLIYPKINLELSCFEIDNDQRTFNLYFSIKKVEEVTNFLVRKGVARNRILLKGYGSSFPLTTESARLTNSALYKRLNQRIEITLHDYETEPVIIHMENILVPDNVMDQAGQTFIRMRHGFYYSIQLTSITQILQNPVLESMNDIFIEVDNTQGNYIYMAGMLPSYKDALAKQGELINAGFPDAKIIPYLDGIRIRPERIASLLSSFPDLQDYQSHEKK
ncbi:MAG TPA: hypothetical protein VJ508_09270, partial [Saprospiraceae bacterium]|nr:hypothetical protein [Saprospiraceae bacterium]